MKKNNKNIKNFIIALIILFIITAILSYIFIKTEERSYSKVTNPFSYEEMYSLIKRINKRNNLKNEISTDYALDSKNYSNTNIQVEGVDEADIVKTDGNYLYALSYENLYIIEANDGNLELISSIKHHENKDNSNSVFEEIYLQDDKLIAIKSKNIFDNKNHPMPEIDNSFDIMLWYGKSETSAVIFDISDKRKPKKLNELTQSGSYLSSRMIENNLYLVTNYYLYDKNYKSNEFDKYIPYTKGLEKETIPLDDIYIAPNPDTSQYIVVTGIDVNNSNNFISKKSVFGSGSNIYSSLENLFVADYDNIKEKDYYKSKTNVLKFSLNDGKVDFKKTKTINGTILNQFSMDEYNDTFRIVTTNYDYKISRDLNDSVSNWNENVKNNLYILDKELNIIGSIEDVAKGERVYSVRFDKEIVYFVTFKQVDPLFAVDLATPESPSIISELKIPGFSEYLHVYNEKYLFGLGKETDKDGKILGMKISMFNISDKKNIQEKYKLFLGEKYNFSEASYNHKAILISPERNLIAFPVCCNNYLIFSFNEKDGFVKIGEINFDNNYWISSSRGLYIKDYFYVFNRYDLNSYSISTFDKVKNLKLEEYPNNIYDKIK